MVALIQYSIHVPVAEGGGGGWGGLEKPPFKKKKKNKKASFFLNGLYKNPIWVKFF